jgi:hypothetical protein
MMSPCQKGVFSKKKYFQCTINTANTSTGSTNNNQFKPPTESSGTYDCIISWGDGCRDRISAWNQAELTHTYSEIGVYDVKIYGTFKGLRFNNTGDRLKITNIQKWDNLQLGNSNGYFYGCTNLQITATDVLKNPTMTTMYTAFYNCTNLNSLINLSDNNILNMYAMFYGCTLYNKPITFSTASVSNMYATFGNTSFNKSVSAIITNNVTTMAYMFLNCPINQDISNLSLKLVTTMEGMLQGATAWSRANYDLFLIGAHAQALSTGVQSGVPFRCVPGYTLGGAAQAAHDYLSGTKNWIFTDGGGV